MSRDALRAVQTSFASAVCRGVDEELLESKLRLWAIEINQLKASERTILFKAASEASLPTPKAQSMPKVPSVGCLSLGSDASHPLVRSPPRASKMTVIGREPLRPPATPVRPLAARPRSSTAALGRARTGPTRPKLLPQQSTDAGETENRDAGQGQHMMVMTRPSSAAKMIVDFSQLRLEVNKGLALSIDSHMLDLQEMLRTNYKVKKGKAEVQGTHTLSPIWANVLAPRGTPCGSLWHTLALSLFSVFHAVFSLYTLARGDARGCVCATRVHWPDTALFVGCTERDQKERSKGEDHVMSHSSRHVTSRHVTSRHVTSRHVTSHVYITSHHMALRSTRALASLSPITQRFDAPDPDPRAALLLSRAATTDGVSVTATGATVDAAPRCTYHILSGAKHT